MPSASRRTPLIAGIVAGAGAVLIIVALVTLERGLSANRNTINFEVAALRARIDYLQRELEASSAQIGELKTQLSLTTALALAAVSPDTRIARLTGTAAASAAAIVALSPGNRIAFMQVTGLSPAPPGKIYQAWWIGAHAQAMRAGLFEAPAEGIAKVELTIPPEGEEIAGVTVTLEPSGGGDKPSGAVCLKGNFSRR